MATSNEAKATQSNPLFVKVRYGFAPKKKGEGQRQSRHGTPKPLSQSHGASSGPCHGPSETGEQGPEIREEGKAKKEEAEANSKTRTHKHQNKGNR